jgi:energy-coupling factor transporter ATP-binding protein EcfA2
MVGALDAFDRLVASAADVAPADVVEEAAAVGRRVRNRRGYLGDTVVVALAGGTGSGKSSLVNALAGEEVAPTGAFRPTTSEPLAWIPADPEPGLIRLLDDLGVRTRVGQDRYPWLAVIDLPDTDSVILEHRSIVHRLLPEVDAVMWVVDPEKYQDRNLHAEHLAPLAAHADQFLFALNQVDRVDPADVGALVEDLRTSLRADGIDEVAVVPTAADPGSGPPEGLEELELALRGLGDAKAVVHRKGLVDLTVAADSLARATGASSGGTGFVAEWDDVVSRASGAVADDVLGPKVRLEAERAARRKARASAGVLARGTGSGGTVDLAAAAHTSGPLAAVRILDTYLTELAGRVGGDTAAEIRGVSAEIDPAVVGAVESVAYGQAVVLPEPPRWAGVIAWVRRALLLAVGWAGVWLFDAVRGGDALGPPVAMVAAGVLAFVAPLLVVGAAGGRAARETLDAQRDAVAVSVGREIHRRLGKRLRDVLRRRAGMTAALAEFWLVARDQD